MAPAWAEEPADAGLALETAAATKTDSQAKQGQQATQPQVLLFWASWCGYCKESLKQADHMYTQVAAVNVFDKVEPTAFLKGMGVKLPSEEASQYDWVKSEVKALPWMVIVDAQGDVIASGKPRATVAATEQWIDSMLVLHSSLAMR